MVWLRGGAATVARSPTIKRHFSIIEIKDLILQGIALRNCDEISLERYWEKCAGGSVRRQELILLLNADLLSWKAVLPCCICSFWSLMLMCKYFKDYYWYRCGIFYFLFSISSILTDCWLITRTVEWLKNLRVGHYSWRQPTWAAVLFDQFLQETDKRFRGPLSFGLICWYSPCRPLCKTARSFNTHWAPRLCSSAMKMQAKKCLMDLCWTFITRK